MGWLIFYGFLSTTCFVIGGMLIKEEKKGILAFITIMAGLVWMVILIGLSGQFNEVLPLMTGK